MAWTAFQEALTGRMRAIRGAISSRTPPGSYQPRKSTQHA
jgi:hypothetical protein